MDGAERSVREAWHAPMHAIYRLRKTSEQSGIQEGLGLKCSQAGVTAGIQALIPLIGITPDSYYSLANAYIYTIHMMVVFHLPPSLFGFLHNYSVFFIYLQNI